MMRHARTIWVFRGKLIKTEAVEKVGVLIKDRYKGGGVFGVVFGFPEVIVKSQG